MPCYSLLARFTQAIDARHTQPTAAGTFSDAAETRPPAQHRDVPGRAACESAASDKRASCKAREAASQPLRDR